MGYFPNGTAGEAYEAEWCNRCVHQKDCGVWMFVSLEDLKRRRAVAREQGRLF